MTRYGYARVSTKDQKLDRQIEALVNAGVPYGHIYKDKVTGAKDGDRTQQKRLFKKMKAGLLAPPMYCSTRKEMAIKIPPPITNGSMWDTPLIRCV